MRGVYIEVRRDNPTFETYAQSLRDRLAGVLNQADRSGVLNAVVTGDRSGLSDDLNERWRAAGIYHVLSVSGLHMAVVAGGTAWLLRRAAVVLWPVGVMRGRGRRSIIILSLLPAWAYCVLAGQSAPALRSLLMTGAAGLAIALGGYAAAVRTLFLSALVLLVLMPETLFDIGARLSYGAIAALLIVAARLPPPQGRRKLQLLRHWLSAAILQSTAVTVAAAPLTAYVFNRLSFYGAPVNVVAAPLAGMGLMAPLTLGLLLHFLPFSDAISSILLNTAGLVVSALDAMAAVVAQWPYAQFYVHRPHGAVPLIWALMQWLLLWAPPQRFITAAAAAVMLGVLFVPGERLTIMSDPERRNVLNTTTGEFCVDRRRPYLIRTWRERAALREDQIRVRTDKNCDGSMPR